MRPLRTLKNILTAPLYAIAAVIVLLEDWLWDDLQRIAAWIGHLPVLRQVESLIERAPRSVALLMFLFPSLILIPVKLLAFGKAVNVTLGLPIIRTSVDHGTAYDIAGKGIANPGSLIEAVLLAARLATS